MDLNINSSVHDLTLGYKAIELCCNGNSLSEIPSEAQERVLSLLPLCWSQPEMLLDAVSHLHLLAVKESNDDLGRRLAQCVKPFLGSLRPNINLVIAGKAQFFFNSLALAQMPYFTALFRGAYPIKWIDTNGLVVKDTAIRISSLICLLEYIQGRHNLSEVGFLKLSWLMQQMDYLYGGFQTAPVTLRESVVEHLMSIVTPERLQAVLTMAETYRLDYVRLIASAVQTGEDLARCNSLLENNPNRNEIMEGLKMHFLQKITANSDNVTVKQLVDSYSIASYFASEEAIQQTFARLTAAIQTPEHVYTLWGLVDSETYLHLHEDCAFLKQLSKGIQLKPGPYDRVVANWAYSKALFYEQAQWGRALASSLIDLNNEFVLAYLEGTLQHRQPILNRDLDYITTQYLLAHVRVCFEVLGDRFDIDKPKMKGIISKEQLSALIFLQRFAKVAHRVTEMDGPYLQGMSQKNLSWLFSKLSPDALISANLDESHINDTTILQPFLKLTSLSLRSCVHLKYLDLIDAMPGLQRLDLSNCIHLNWRVGWVAPKNKLTHLGLENVEIGNMQDLQKFPLLNFGNPN